MSHGHDEDKSLTFVLLSGVLICFLTESVSGNGGPARRGSGRPRGNHNKSGKFKEIFGEERTDVPDFCHKKSCPKFEIIEETEEYQLREYEASTWLAISRNDEQSKDKQSKRQMFRALFSYLLGNNNENKTVTMGIPVLKKMVPDDDSAQSMLFYISQDNPPKPNDEKLRFVPFPKQLVYVRVFGGYANPKRTRDNYVELVDYVDEDKVDIDSYYVGSFDAPWVKERHNEIWLLPKNDAL